MRDSRSTHRAIILVALALSGLMALALSAQPPAHASGPDTPIAQENAQPGTRDWITADFLQSQSPRDRSTPPAQLRTAALWNDTSIRGYTGQASYKRDEPVDLRVATTAPTYDIEVYRMGWYDGTGARLMETILALPGLDQPVPTPDPTTGLTEANWQITHTLQPAADWISGVYLAKLIASTGPTEYILFVLRDDAAPADIVFQLPLTTYQAYNNWGGKSLYHWNSTNGVQARKVSFDRPYTGWNGAGSFFDGDYNMVRWLEREGYNVVYSTSVEVERGTAFSAGGVFLSNFHDEYWSANMRNNLVAAQAAGVDQAFFDSNNIYWQIRFEPSSTGVADRVVVGYKDAALDPLSASQPALTTVRWRDVPVSQPENAVLGVMYLDQFNYGDSFPWIVSNASHWVYAGTGLIDGDGIPGLVGYEPDLVVDNGFTPPGLSVLSESPFVDRNGINRVQNAVLFQRPSGAIIFSAATNYWSWKLDDNEILAFGADARVQQMTRNLLNAMITAPPVPPSTLTAALTILNDDGGTATTADLTLRAGGGEIPAGIAQPLPSGPDTLAVDPLLGYTITIGGDCATDGSFTLLPGDALTCTVLADDLAAGPATHTIYDDALAPGWANWSWNTTVNFAAPSPVYTGSAALAAEVTVTWGGLYLHANTPLDLSPYSELRFFAQATAPGQQYWIHLVGVDNLLLGNAIPLA
ncbi:MAG: hypothetical protein DK306_001415, partial [Chloroflexi bacterium]